MHDREVKVIRARDFPKWLIVPDNPKWLAHQEALVKRLMASGFDGLFVDSMGTAPVDSGNDWRPSAG